MHGSASICFTLCSISRKMNETKIQPFLTILWNYVSVINQFCCSPGSRSLQLLILRHAGKLKPPYLSDDTFYTEPPTFVIPN